MTGWYYDPSEEGNVICHPTLTIDNGTSVAVCLSFRDPHDLEEQIDRLVAWLNRIAPDGRLPEPNEVQP